jgi:hypothetical protein
MKRENVKSVSKVDALYVEDLRRIVEVSTEGWRLLAGWGAETSSLDPSQRKLALNISRALRSGRRITAEEANRAVAILDRAAELGFQLVAP